jgi:hypothetical protein
VASFSFDYNVILWYQIGMTTVDSLRRSRAGTLRSKPLIFRPDQCRNSERITVYPDPDTRSALRLLVDIENEDSLNSLLISIMERQFKGKVKGDLRKAIVMTARRNEVSASKLIQSAAESYIDRQRKKYANWAAMLEAVKVNEIAGRPSMMGVPWPISV